MVCRLRSCWLVSKCCDIPNVFSCCCSLWRHLSTEAGLTHCSVSFGCTSFDMGLLYSNDHFVKLVLLCWFRLELHCHRIQDIDTFPFPPLLGSWEDLFLFENCDTAKLAVDAIISASNSSCSLLLLICCSCSSKAWHLLKLQYKQQVLLFCHISCSFHHMAINSPI